MHISLKIFEYNILLKTGENFVWELLINDFFFQALTHITSFVIIA